MTHMRSKSLDTILWPNGAHSASNHHSLPGRSDMDQNTSREDEDDDGIDDAPAERPELLQLRELPLVERLLALKVRLVRTGV